MNFFDINQNFIKRTLYIDDQDRQFTYGDWYKAASDIKGIIPSRSLVAIICHNVPASAISYLSCLQNQIVPFLVDAQMDSNLQSQLLDLYKPNYIFRPKEDCPRQSPLYTIDTYGIFRAYNMPHQLHENLALLLTTSGSTGSPKLVRQSYTNIQSNAASIAEYLHLSKEDRPISTLPMHYTFGLSVINSHALCGASEVLTESTVLEQDFWDVCKKNKATSIAGVPFTYECLNRLGFRNMELPNITLMIQAGGHLPSKLQKAFMEYAKETKKRFIVMYGQTEATARMAYLPFEKGLDKLGSIGVAIPGGTFHIMDENHHEIQTPHTVGELCYEGPNVTMGYATKPTDLSLGDTRNGFLYTGDMSYVDEDGFYYIVGRKKRFIKIMGKRINMDEIEQLLKNQFTSLDFACEGYDDDLHCFTTGKKDTYDALEDYLIQRLNIHPRCFSIHTIPSVPKNSSGKTQYRLLKESISNMKG